MQMKRPPLLSASGFAEGTLACMKAAYDAGINFFDTAEVYAGGESEVVMGEAIKEFGWKRNDLVISTKVSPPRVSTHPARQDVGP